MKLSRFFIYLIGLYQKHLSSWMPSCCRYWPSCSEYTKEALEKYGFFWGGLKGLRRLLRCHPLTRRDIYDPLR